MIQIEPSSKRSLLSWFQKNRAPHPWRKLWAKSKDPYVVWVSEIMLQQTRIEAVTPKYIHFLKKFPTIAALAKSKESDLREAVSGLGYYRRFKWMTEAAKSLHEMDKEFPRTFEDLLNVKGIGNYTASAISSICFNEQRAVCDGNIERIYCRIHNIQKPSNDSSVKSEAAQWATAQLPSTKPGAWNEAMMELGQKICTPTSPDCQNCPIAIPCSARKTNTQHLAPAKKVKPTKKHIALKAHVLISQVGKQMKIGLIKRSEKHRFLRDMVGFDFEITDADPATAKFKHTITNHLILGSVVIKKIKNPRKGFTWVDSRLLKKALHSSLDKKIWTAALQVL